MAFDLSVLTTSEGWISLLMLTFMEIVLGIDNIIFISIVANRLPQKDEAKARNIGLMLAMAFRIILLFGISFVIAMQQPLISFDAFGKHVGFTGQSLILIAGGLFLMYKSVSEIHQKLEGEEAEDLKSKKTIHSITKVVIQISLLNIVFSFDSILTAIGLSSYIVVMILSVIISMAIMMLFAGRVGRFINEHPSMQMLGLSFLILIGLTLLAEGGHKAHLLGVEGQEEVIPKGYLYFAIFFSLGVEILNIRMRKKSKRILLHGAAEKAEKEGILGLGNVDETKDDLERE